MNAKTSVIYARGAHKATKIKIPKLWNRLWGIPIISETTAHNRFVEIMRFLRFDSVENCPRHYRLCTDITADEQLFPTKTRCRFTQYMSNKPNKFGIKFWMTADVKTKYMLNSFICMGKNDSHPAGVTLGEDAVL